MIIVCEVRQKNEEINLEKSQSSAYKHIQNRDEFKKLLAFNS